MSDSKEGLSEIAHLRMENDHLRREKELLQFHSSLDQEKFIKPGLDEIKNIIPAFDPSKGSGCSAKLWIETLENTRNVYKWDDRSLLFYASLRLEKAAQAWYSAQKNSIPCWETFKAKLIQVFPRPRDKSAISRKERKQICFNCKELGHFARNCQKPEPKSDVCPVVPNFNMRCVLQSDNCVKDSYLVKTVKVCEAVMEAFLDFGSDCTTLVVNKAIAYKWSLEPCDVKLKGFAGSTVQVLGRIGKVVRVDEVAMRIEIFVVPNEAQNVSMILGRNFLNAPKVCVVKKFGSVEVMSID